MPLKSLAEIRGGSNDSPSSLRSLDEIRSGGLKSLQEIRVGKQQNSLMNNYQQMVDDEQNWNRPVAITSDPEDVSRYQESQFPAQNSPSFLDKIGQSLSPSLAWQGLKNFVSGAKDDFVETPHTLNYPFAKIAEYAVPDAPLIGQREDGTYGNLPGTNARQSFSESNPVQPTGDPLWDKGSDLIGQFVGPMVGSYGTGIGAIPGMVDNALTRAGVQFGEGALGKVGKGVVEGAITGAPFNVAATLATKDPTMNDLVKSANEGILLGGGLGAAGGALAAGMGKLGGNRLMSLAEIQSKPNLSGPVNDFISKVDQSPSNLSSGRIVQTVDNGMNQGQSWADNFNRGEAYQKALNNQYPTQPQQLADMYQKQFAPPVIDSPEYVNNKTWYHGTGTDGLTAESLYPFGTNHEGLFGQGVYLTDNPSIAQGYAKSRGKRTGTEAVYQANVKVDRVLNLEKPLTPDVGDILKKTFGGLDNEFNEYDFNGIVDNAIKHGESFERTFKKIQELIREHSQDNGWGKDEYMEHFQDFLVNMKKNGYDAVTHTGGLRTGHEKHRVLIMLDPNDMSETGRAGQVTRFDKFDGEIAPKVKANHQQTKTTEDITRAQEYRNQHQQAIEDQYTYLKQSMVNRGGIEQGGVIKDRVTGEATGRYGRVSNNPEWYQQFHKDNGRAPNNAELRAIAAKQVNEGFQTEVGKAPSWKPSDIQEIDNQLSDIKEALHHADAETRSSLEQTAKVLRQERNRLKQSLPEGVQAMQQEMRKTHTPYRTAAPTADSKPITRKEVVDNLRKNLGVTIRTGRLGTNNQNVLGLFKVNPEVVRSRQAGDLQVIAHEIGHQLDKKHGLIDPRFDNELVALGQRTAGKNPTIDKLREEGVAEFIRLYMTDPRTARQSAPQFAQFFERRIPEKVMKGIEASQKDIANWIDQGEAMQLRSKINRSGKDQRSSFNQVMNKVYTNFSDRFHPFAVVEKTINKMQTGAKKLSDASKSLYKKARLSVGAPRKAQQFLEEHLKPILDRLDKFGYTVKDLGDYSTAVHADELEKAWHHNFQQAIMDAQQAKGKPLTMDEIRKIKEENRIESGFTQAEIRATMKKYDSPEMKAMQQELVGFNNKLLKYMHDNQLISTDAMNAMRKKYPNYVPFYRFFDESGNSSLFGTGKGFADITSPIKKIKGSDKDIIDPIESMIKNTFTAISAVERNKVGLELARLADVEGAGKFVERLSGDARSPKENIVTVYENGERVQYQLDPELYRAMKQLDEESSNMLVKILSAPASMLRAGATLTPEFILRNPIRDQFHAFVASDSGYNPLIDLPKGIFSALRKDHYYKSWIEEGGAHGQYVSQDRNVMRKMMQDMKDQRGWMRRTADIGNPAAWLRLMQRISELSEEGTKVGEFRKAIKKGTTPEEAAFRSRDLMDFARSGNNVKQINKVISFFNANIQGKDRLARAFGQHPVRSTIRAVTAVTLPTVAVYYINKGLVPYWPVNDKQKEEIDNAPQWLKDTFFLLAVPGTDVVARIPKPFDLAPVFSNSVENILRYIDGKDHQTTLQYLEGAGIDLINMPYMLTGLTPWIENIANYSFFTGGPIVPKKDQGLLPEDQYGVNTSSTARAIGKATGTSPYKADNLIRGYAAGLGKYATSATDAVIDKTGILPKQPPREEKKISEFPVLNAFTVNYNGGKSMDDFYNTLNQLDNQVKSNQKNQTFDGSAASSKAQYEYMQKIGDQIAKLRKVSSMIQQDMKMSPQQKRHQLDAIDNQMTMLSKEAMKGVKQFKQR